MKLAIMQPYYLPYLGYWQLFKAVDRFVIYDDVNYITRGWINRNRILIDGKPSYITVPLSKASQNKQIYDILLHSAPAWRRKMIKSIENTYRKAPFFNEVFPVIEKIIFHETDSLVGFLKYQFDVLSEFMGIKTDFVLNSRYCQNKNLSGQNRILDICKREGANVYINLQGGKRLYDSESFQRANIALHFMVMRPIPYKQRSTGFVPFLSIVDALMEIGAHDIEKHLDSFDLQTNGNNYVK